MNARDLLRQVVLNKTAALCGGRPNTNAPAKPEYPEHPETNAARKKRAGAVEGWLTKLAAQNKTAARRPGRLDCDETLSKLAARRSSKKRNRL